MTPIESIHAGIQVIFQDFSIFPNLTVAENICVNKLVSSDNQIVNWYEMKKTAKSALEKIGVNIDLTAKVESLSVADKQIVAITRALLQNAKLIIMDEPTTALTKKKSTRCLRLSNSCKHKVLPLYLSAIKWMKYLKSRNGSLFCAAV